MKPVDEPDSAIREAGRRVDVLADAFMRESLGENLLVTIGAIIKILGYFHAKHDIDVEAIMPAVMEVSRGFAAVIARGDERSKLN